MFLLVIAVLATGSTRIDPDRCHEVRRGEPGAARWETDGRGGLSISFDARSAGEVSLRCRVKLPPGSDAATLQFDDVLISFQPTGSKESGSGVVLSSGSCRGPLLRVAGEDWIRASRRAWSFARPASGTLDILITARDVSRADPLRIDFSGLRLTPGRVNEVDICQPVDDKLDGNGGQNQPH